MTFELHRPDLLRLAYGMIGSRAGAEDIVQEVWIRRQGAQVEHERAWLRKVTTRLALDELKSARVRRETYVGAWLPEPVSDWVDPVEHAEALSMATLALLERCSPLERAVFLLRELFELAYAEIGSFLARSESSVRQLMRRARAHLADRPRFEPPADAHFELLGAVAIATQTGDLEALKALLADDVCFTSDGGGVVKAAIRPVHGVDSVARLLIGLNKKFGEGSTYSPAFFNGHLGLWIHKDGEAQSANMFCFSEGKLTAMYAIRNPAKMPPHP